MTRTQQAVSRIQAALQAAGWEQDGQTDVKQVRVPTMKSPVFGGTGGELVKMGGRDRWKKGQRRVTVGARTTFFWTIGKNDGRQFSTVIEEPKIIGEVQHNDA